MTLIYAVDLAFFKEIRSKVQLTKIVKKFKVYYGILKYRTYGLPHNLIVIKNCDEWGYCIDSLNGKT